MDEPSERILQALQTRILRLEAQRGDVVTPQRESMELVRTAAMVLMVLIIAIQVWQFSDIRERLARLETRADATAEVLRGEPKGRPYAGPPRLGVPDDDDPRHPAPLRLR